MLRNYIELGFTDGIPRLVKSVNVPDPITSLRAKRGTKVECELQFLRDGIPELLPDDYLIRYTVKQKGKYDGAALVTTWDADWTAPDDATGFYTATIDYDTTALNDLMLSPDGDATNDVSELEAMGAFSWGPVGVEPTETAEFKVLIANLINNEGTSAATNAGVHPAQILELAGYTGGGATKLDGIPTVGVRVPSVLLFLHTTEGVQRYVLVASSDAESSPAIIRPDDYDASTNAKVWKSS